MKNEIIMQIACIPCVVCDVPPTVDGQTGYQKDPCPQCGELMWTTDKKRAWHHKNPNEAMICMICCIKNMRKLGLDPLKDPEFIDMSKPN